MIFRRVIGSRIVDFPATVANPYDYRGRVEVLDCGHDGRVERILGSNPLPPTATKRSCRVCADRVARREHIGLRIVK